MAKKVQFGQFLTTKYQAHLFFRIRMLLFQERNVSIEAVRSRGSLWTTYCSNVMAAVDIFLAVRKAFTS